MAGCGVTEQPGAVGNLPGLGVLLERALVTGRLAFDLGAGHRQIDTGLHAPAVGGEVGLAVGGDQRQPAPFGGVDPVLKLAGLTGQPVEVPDHQGIEQAANVQDRAAFPTLLHKARRPDHQPRVGG